MIQITEHIVNIWENDKALKEKYIDQVWDIITAAYESIGGCNCDKSELFDNNIYWKLTKRGERITALCIYKLTSYGRKLFLLAAEASPEGKRDIRKMMEEDAKQDNRHFYAEVSEAPEYMYIKRGAKLIPVSTAQNILGDNKPIAATGEDDYHYTRAIGPDKKQFRKIMVGNPKLEGISSNGDTYQFDFDTDKPEDLIELTGPELYQSSINDNVYWFGYKFKDNISSKTKSDFIHWIKGLTDNKPTSKQYEIIISRPFNRLCNQSEVDDISLIVSPRSERSQLVTRIIKIAGDILPHSIARSSVELVKNANKDVEFDWELFDEQFSGDYKQYNDIKKYINEILLPRIHSGEYFSISRDVKPKYRPYIKDYLIADFNTRQKINNVQNGSILIIDDINTTGSTLNEVVKSIRSINKQCRIYIFTLIGN